MSPLQFQKQLRLHAARQKMLADELDAAGAALEELLGAEVPPHCSSLLRETFCAGKLIPATTNIVRPNSC